MKHQTFVLLDRDGTINVERHYLSSPEGVELLPGAAEGLRRLAERNVGLVVVTNQSGLRRGYFDRAALDAVHERLQDLLGREGVRLDAIYICPHVDEDHCDCRKPLPGLVRQAAAELGFDPRQAFLVGDKVCDVELGRAVGATTLLVRTGYGALVEAGGYHNADFIVDDLREAADVIGRLLGREEGR